MNAKGILLVVGLIVGGLYGWFHTPADVDVKVGGMQVQVQGGQGTVTTGNDASSGVSVNINAQPQTFAVRAERAAIWGIVAGAIGFVLGFLFDRRRPA